MLFSRNLRDGLERFVVGEVGEAMPSIPLGSSTAEPARGTGQALALTVKLSILSCGSTLLLDTVLVARLLLNGERGWRRAFATHVKGKGRGEPRSKGVR